MKLTQRAFLLGAVALCFYLVAVVNSLPSFYYVLVWLGVGLLASSLGIALLSLTGTTCTLRERRSSGYARGGFGANEAPPLWEAVFGNDGSLNKTGLELELRLQRHEEGARGKGKNVVVLARFLVEALPTGAKLEAPLALDFLPRGVYSLHSARLVGSDVLGLFRASKKLALPATPLEVVVASPILPLSLRREFTRGGGGRDGPRPTSRLGAGEDLRGVRPYVPGDDWRHVHWATTARTGDLAVREFESNTRDAVLVVWDGGLSDVSISRSPSLIEDELSLVASLLVAIDARQTPVGVAICGRGEGSISANGQDGLLSRSALKALALARPERTRPLSIALGGDVADGCGNFSRVIVVSSSLQGDLVEYISSCAARREMPIVALFETAVPPPPRASKRDAGHPTLTPFETQERALRAVGAHVVRVPLLQGETTGATLERALFELLEPS